MLKLILLVFLLTLSACGDKNASPTTPTSTPAPAPPPAPRRASITLEIMGASAIVTEQGNAVRADLRLVESGGARAIINFARLEVYRATGQFEERAELPGSQIGGSNRIEANTTFDLQVLFFFQATVKRGKTLQFTVGFTDDGGNTRELVQSLVFVK